MIIDKKWVVSILFVFIWLFISCSKTKEGARTDHEQKEIYEWKMVTTWPKNFPGLGTGANRLAEMIGKMTAGQIKIKVYGGGELVGPLEAFDAVSRGTAEMGHGAAYYWKGKAPEAQFFAAVPFGLTAQEMNGWLYYGGGMKLWEEAYAPHGLIPLSAGNTGVQMGGWFNKEIKSVKDLKGLKMRLPGLGAEALEKLGGTPVLLPGGELFAALQSGAIDATEWVGPFNDLAFGLYKTAKYYYYPGWHEPGTTLETFVNQEAFNQLPENLQSVIRVAAKAANLDMLSEFTAKNNESLRILVEEHEVKLKEFPKEVLKALADAMEEVYQEKSSADPNFKEVYDSFKAFRDQVIDWHNVSERSYLNRRAEIFGK